MPCRQLIMGGPLRTHSTLIELADIKSKAVWQHAQSHHALYSPNYPGPNVNLLIKQLILNIKSRVRHRQQKLLGRADCGPPTFCSVWAGTSPAHPLFGGHVTNPHHLWIHKILIAYWTLMSKKVCQSAPEHTNGRLKTKKKFLGRGTAPSLDSSPLGRRYHSPDPTPLVNSGSFIKSAPPTFRMLQPPMM